MGKSRHVIRAVYIREQLIGRQPCFHGKALQDFRRSAVNTGDQVGNRHLAHSHTRRKFFLGRSCSLEILGQGFHMDGETIGLPYSFAIGRSYEGMDQNWFMPKTRERSFLERALEALQDRYPREKPTQTKLAKIVSVSQPAVFEWGLPDRAPAHPAVLKLAKELNVCVEWLYTGRGPKRPEKAEQSPEPFMQTWQDLDPEKKRQVARYTEFIKGETDRQ